MGTLKSGDGRAGRRRKRLPGRVDGDVYERLQDQAEAAGRSLSEFVEAAIVNGLPADEGVGPVAETSWFLDDAAPADKDVAGKGKVAPAPVDADGKAAAAGDDFFDVPSLVEVVGFCVASFLALLVMGAGGSPAAVANGLTRR
jgi:hypothetical protein